LANLFKTYIRPILEFASPVFSPYLEKDIKKLESVQKVYLQCCYNRIFFKKVQTPSYDFLLKYFKIESLQKRRLKADYKISHQYMLGILPFPEQNAFRCVNSKTRGDMFKIQTNPSKTKIRQNSFFTRTSVLYSKLPIETRQKDLSDFMKDIDSLLLTGNDLWENPNLIIINCVHIICILCTLFYDHVLYYIVKVAWSANRTLKCK